MTQFFSVDIDLLNVGLTSGSQSQQALFYRVGLEAVEEAPERVVMSDAVWQGESQGLAQPVHALRVGPIGHVLEGFSPAQNGAQSDHEQVGQWMSFSAVDAGIVHLRESLVKQAGEGVGRMIRGGQISHAPRLQIASIGRNIEQNLDALTLLLPVERPDRAPDLYKRQEREIFPARSGRFERH